jgi:hypothetical protein
MKRTVFILSLLLCSFFAFAGNYNSFKVSVYTRAQEVEKMKDMHWLDSTWRVISRQVKVDKIYLETYRDMHLVPDETIRQAKEFFKNHGVEVAGGITFTIDESNNFETFCYSNPEHRKMAKHIAEYTAKYFDQFILDDFFFTSCKSDIEIKSKGKMSWSEYRMKLMTEAGKELVIKAAKSVNPNVKITIKYPNWYDHFQGLGFDLKNGPQIFDGIWTGTETRNPAGNQHLQNYLSYNIIRYYENLRPGHNGGGWVDMGGSEMGLDRYAEQLWLTLFAKAPEVTLFAYNQLLDARLEYYHPTPWQGLDTSFSYDELMKPIALPDGQSVEPTTLARAAGVTFDEVNKFIYKLGKPLGIKSYKPFHSLGDDFLQNYLGMIGLPMDMYSSFPTDQKVVLLTEQAKYDENIIDKIKFQLQRGGDVVITSSLLRAIPDKIAEIAELRCDNLKAIVNDFGNNGKSHIDILIPQVRYQTNDCWEIVSAGRPLTNGVSGYPMLLRGSYSNGNLYVLTIPDDMGNLYSLPEKVLNVYRKIMSKDLGIYIEGPSKVSLFVYDNGTFIVESFNNTPVNIRIVTTKKADHITDVIEGDVLKMNIDKKEAYGRYFFKTDSEETRSHELTLKPHSFRVFELK